MKKLSVLIMMGLIILVSCNKNDNNEINNEPILIPDYTPMEVGYYWVYEHVIVDSLGNETPLPHIRDSLYISKDTIIRGGKYFKFQGSNFGIFPNRKFLRDSNDYLVNEMGIVLFSSENFKDVLYIDTSYQPFDIQYRMNHIDSIISVPFGVFETLDYEGTVYSNGLLQYPWDSIFIHNFHGKEVGVVKSTYFFHTTAHLYTYERRLISSNIQMDK